MTAREAELTALILALAEKLCICSQELGRIAEGRHDLPTLQRGPTEPLPGTLPALLRDSGSQGRLPAPTSTIPGGKGRILVLESRAERKVSLRHQEDSKGDAVDVPCVLRVESVKHEGIVIPHELVSGEAVLAGIERRIGRELSIEARRVAAWPWKGVSE